jgi:hypothetical protein
MSEAFASDFLASVPWLVNKSPQRFAPDADDANHVEWDSVLAADATDLFACKKQGSWLEPTPTRPASDSFGSGDDLLDRQRK